MSTLEPETVNVDTDYYKALEAVAHQAGMLRSMALPSERQAGDEVVMDHWVGALEIKQLDAALKAWYAAQQRQEQRRRQARQEAREQAQMRLIA